MERAEDDGHPMMAAARLALEQWSGRLGTAGMAAMRVMPALRAEVDQHAAHVRDELAGHDGLLHPVLLAAYADGVADVAGARGWSPAETRAGGWSAPTWASVRLLAVCVLAEAALAEAPLAQAMPGDPGPI